MAYSSSFLSRSFLLAVLAAFPFSARMALGSFSVSPIPGFPLPKAAFVDQDGKPFQTEAVRGHVAVVDLIFTSCQSVCPALTQTMARVDRETRKADVRFYSISVDPARDTPGRLRAFAKRHGADFQRWRFLTGKTEEVDRFVRHGLMTALDRSGKEIVHSERFFLVDREGNVRAMPSVRTEEEIQKVIESILALATPVTR